MAEKSNTKMALIEKGELEEQFAYVDTIIERHRFAAFRQICHEALLTNWEVGQYVSDKLKSAAWGDKVVTELADYLKRHNPKRRGFSKRNLYIISHPKINLGMHNLKFFLITAVCCLLPWLSRAETKQTRDNLRHEFRIGYGDPMYETMRWKDESNRLPVPMNVRQNYRYTGHIYGEYMYRVNSWFGVGGQVDFGATTFDYNTYCLDAGGHQYLAASDPRFFYDVCVMPSFRFTYFHSEWVNLYSGVQLGVGIHADYLGRCELGCAAGLTALGVSVGRNHWFGAAEVGGLNSLQSLTAIYLIWSRWFNLSVGYRF